MAVSFVASGAWVSGTASITPTIPAHVANDLLVLCLVSKYEDASLGTITGELANWTDHGGTSNLTRTAGNDNGGLRLRFFTRVAPAAGTAAPALAPTPNNMSFAHVTVYRVAAGQSYGLSVALGADDTTGSPLEIGSVTGLGLAANDFVHADLALNGDVVTFGTTTITSGTGAVFSALSTNVADTAFTAGTDARARSVRWSVTTPPTVEVATMVSSTLAGTTTNAVGTGSILRIREVIPPPPNLTVSPAGVASAESVGSPTITTTVTAIPAGVVSAESVGSPSVSTTSPQTVSPTGVSSVESVGSATVATTVTAIPAGVVSAESVGSPTATTGAVTVSPGGITSGQSVGAPTAAAGGVTVTPGGVASAEAVGSPTVTPGAVTATPAGVASAETVGSPIAIISGGPQTASPVGVVSAESVGSPTSTPGPVTITPAGVSSSESVGSPTATPGAVTVLPEGVTSAEAVGSPTATVGAPSGPLTISPAGVDSSGSVGALTVTTVGLPALLAASDAASISLLAGEVGTSLTAGSAPGPTLTAAAPATAHLAGSTSTATLTTV